MLRWVVLFLLAAVVASVFGFFGVASAAVGVAKLIFFVSLAGFVISLVLHLVSLRNR